MELRFGADVNVSDITSMIESVKDDEPNWGPLVAWWEVPSPLIFYREFEMLKNMVLLLQEKNERLEEKVGELSDRCSAYEKQLQPVRK